MARSLVKTIPNMLSTLRLALAVALPFTPESWWLAILPLAGFTAERIETHYLENALSGRLLVLSGRLRNASASAVATPAPLQLSLLDADGVRIAAPAAPVGRRLPEKRLREEAPEALREVLAASGRAWSRRPMAPQASRQFTAIFPELPAEAERLVFERVGVGAEMVQPAR